jgi:hypothetical protein
MPKKSRAKEIKNLKFEESKDPEVISFANRLAKLENRRAHDAMRLFIEIYGPKRIAELEQVRSANAG